MESPQKETPRQDDEEVQLSREVLAKVEELLNEDGKKVKIFPNVGPSKVVTYGFDISNNTIGGESTLPEGTLTNEVSAEITLNRTPAEGVAKKTLILIRISDRGVQELSFTLSFFESRAPTFQYNREEGETSRRNFFVREARREDLEDFFDILEKPLYVKGR